MRDSRLRKHLMKLSKLVKKQHDFQLAKLNRIDRESQESSENLKKKIKELQKRTEKNEHHLELIDEALKVKPVHIKTEKIRETFDHRLVVLNIALIFINILLALHIVAN